MKTSPWDGLSEIIAVASTVDARSNVRAPEVVICPEGVTVTGNIRSTFIINTRCRGLGCLAVDIPVLNHPANSQISKRPVIPTFGSHVWPIQLERGIKAPFGFWRRCWPPAGLCLFSGCTRPECSLTTYCLPNHHFFNSSMSKNLTPTRKVQRGYKTRQLLADPGLLQL